MQKIINYYGRTGAGKSTKMLANIIEHEGRHLLVVSRKNSIQQCYDDLIASRNKAGLNFPIIKFLRETWKRSDVKISKAITDKAAEFPHETDHCCLIITQAAFQQLVFYLFRGWLLKLDELLSNGNLSGELFSPVMWPGLASLFDIEPLTEVDVRLGIDPSLCRLTMKPGVEAKDVFRDVRLTKEDQNLFNRVASSVPVYIDAKKFEDIGRRSCKYCSPWTLDLAEGFASIEIAACDIEHSLMHLLSPWPYEMVLIHSPVSFARIRIIYFDASAATCSSEYWKTDQGKANLELVGQEIARRGGVDFWTCNETAELMLKPLMPKTSAIRSSMGEMLNDVDGTWITQQQDGINRYRGCTSCAIIISSKAQEHESIFEKLNPAANRQAISRSREDSLIFQFVSRGAIRMDGFAGDYTIFVFDRQQAEVLRDKLVSYAFADVEIEHVEIDGFTDRVRPARGRKPSYLTPEERENVKREAAAQRQREHRKRKRMTIVERTAEDVPSC